MTRIILGVFIMILFIDAVVAIAFRFSFILGYTRGLADDSAALLTGRIQNFQEFIMPILKYGSYCQRLITVQGELSPDMMLQDLLEKLD